MQLRGKGVSNGIAIGKIKILQKEQFQVNQLHILNVEAEKERFCRARELAKNELQRIFEKTKKEIGEEEAAIFEAHQMLLEDMNFIDSILQMIENQKVNAEFAVDTVGENFALMFHEMDDIYMKERATDMKDVSYRLIRILNGKEETLEENHEPVVWVAEEITPSEVATFQKDKVLAFVTKEGTFNSHAAILARTLGIPALVGIEYLQEVDGKFGIVDGSEGVFYVEPGDEIVEKYRDIQKQREVKKLSLQALKGKESRTRDGRTIAIYANVGNEEDAKCALENDAEGIGLFRSEFLYLEKEDYPSEEEQFEAYKNVVETMQEKKVIIRTVDIGADKQAKYFELKRETNPALGYRGIRVSLDRIGLFKTQLRAICRSAYYGNVAVMFPMIISLNEVVAAKAILEEVYEELEKENINYRKPEVGIMIETPAAAMISDLLAEEVDFFSVGTNDLSQYMLAIDRQNEAMAPIFDTHHEGILRMIALVVKNAHEKKCKVGICGELGADLSLTQWFLEIGVDGLSVVPSMVLPLREKVCEI